MRFITGIVIHCSATPDASDFGFEDINLWHLGNGWKSPKGIGCGYHFIIRRCGSIELGRTIDEIGAHVHGANKDTIGICMVGTHEFNAKQFNALYRLNDYLRLQFGDLTIKGHREYPSGAAQGKTCPVMDMDVVRLFLKGAVTVAGVVGKNKI